MLSRLVGLALALVVLGASGGTVTTYNYACTLSTVDMSLTCVLETPPPPPPPPSLLCPNGLCW